MGASYAVAFYLLSITLTTLPIGIANAIWSGLGIVLISLVGLFVFKQTLDLPAVIGLGLHVAADIVVNVSSDSLRHSRRRGVATPPLTRKRPPPTYSSARQLHTAFWAQTR